MKVANALATRGGGAGRGDDTADVVNVGVDVAVRVVASYHKKEIAMESKEDTCVGGAEAC